MFKTRLKPHLIVLVVLFLVAGPLCVCAQEEVPQVPQEEVLQVPQEEVLQVSQEEVAQVSEPSVRFELLTCSPGPLVYELYGHTSLRAIDDDGLDVVFNYGVFDFRKPHFVWNFVLGHTDYMVVPIPFELFLEEYRKRGSFVKSQRLNLTADEATRLMRSLMDNTLPQNRVYRYNYLSNNCTTKVRDMIESAIDGEVKYREEEKFSYRECLQAYTAEHPWAELGNAMLLGATVDTILTDRNSAFLPERLMAYYNDAVIYDVEGNSRPLLSGSTITLVEARDVPVEPEFPLSPLQVILCFAGLSILVFVCELAFKRMIWGYDLLVMLALGASGILVWFMFFFSEHPSVDTNWQIWLYNPLPLFCMPWVVWKAIKKKFCLYHLVNMAILILFLVFSPWIPQHFAVVTLPLACTLLLRPVSYYIYYSRVTPKVQAAGKNEKPAKKKNSK